MLKNKDKLYELDKFGNSFIHRIVEWKFIKLIQLMDEDKIDFNMPDSDGNNCLMITLLISMVLLQMHILKLCNMKKSLQQQTQTMIYRTQTPML